MTKAPTTGMVSVYAGQQCLGFILSRGKAGFEARNADDQSIGTFKTQAEAVAAVSAAATGGEP
jgi:hypothetical protein